MKKANFQVHDIVISKALGVGIIFNIIEDETEDMPIFVVFLGAINTQGISYYAHQYTREGTFFINTKDSDCNITKLRSDVEMSEDVENWKNVSQSPHVIQHIHTLTSFITGLSKLAENMNKLI
jgi:hypothetical protein